MQDAVAIAVAIATGCWLVWSLLARVARPSCCPPPSSPAGSDGFVPLESLSNHRPSRLSPGSAHESGRPEGRPDR
jgi:hypothetical protein